MNKARIKRRFRKKFGRKITATEINQIWDRWIASVIKRVAQGERVVLDKHSNIQVTGRPLWEDEAFVKRLMKGRMVRNGVLCMPNLHPKRREIIYSIEYKNSLAKGPIYFKPSRNLKDAVKHMIKNTNTYFRINE